MNQTDPMNHHHESSNSLTRLLNRAADGDLEAKGQLYQLIYDDLRDAARRVMRDKQRGDLQTTALVHESLLRFENQAVLQKYSGNRRIFFSVAIRAMQQVLVDHNRKKRREKRRTEEQIDAFDQTIESIEKQSGFDFEALTMAIDELRDSSPRQHAVVMHRFFGGLSIDKTAELLDVSVGTVERDWRLARARLMLRLGNSQK